MARYEFPTSPAQRRMWLLARLDPDEPTYNVAWTVRLDGELDLDTLRRAWDTVLLRHESLRTWFRDEFGLPVQVVEDDPVLDPLELTAVDGPPAVRALVDELARTPFDLTAGPPLRTRLVRLTPREHVLVVVAHHIVADGWSFRIVFDELSADYEAILRTGVPATDEPPIQYADFAIWQAEHAEDGGYATAERSWRKELAGATTALALPTDAPYPARQTFAAGTIETTLDEPLTSALRQVAAERGITLFAVLLAAYSAVLARLSGTDDLLVAVPMAARTRSETEPVVGLFMNTVPIRVRVDRRGGLGDLARSVHAATARAIGHQDLPFARIVELLRPERDQARSPLVQVMFSMEEPWGLPDRGGLRWSPELVENGNLKFELELAVTDAMDATDGPQVRINYNSTLFHADTARLVADGFLGVLLAMAEDPDRAVAAVEIMPPATYALVTDTWPDAGPVADPDATAVAQLWQSCTGGSVVVEGPDGALTGVEVLRRAAAIAAALRAYGVGPVDRVGILLPRGARLLPAMLGIWLVGAGYVPLDVIYPRQRLATMLDLAGARAIVIDSGVPGASEPPPTTAEVAVVDLAGLAPAGDLPPPPDPVPSAPAYTIFTSGSTGRPKAVTVTQGNLAALLAGLRPMFALGPDDRFVAATTITFDIAMVELLAPVLGCRVIVADDEQATDPVLLRRLLADSGATAFQATPTGWRALLAAGAVPAGVRLRISIGEPLPRDLADAIGGRPGDSGPGAWGVADGPGAWGVPDGTVRLWNMYGPTETTVYSGGALVDPSPAPLEIGSNLPGTRLYVLDADLRPVPPGVPGEVCIGGAGVATGYHAAPALTVSQFLPDPYGGRPGARLYRTGDLGRWRRSGHIELAGRADRQLKIRGYRVESGEIETVLRAHPDVEDAVVSLRGGEADVRLVAYLQTRSCDGRAPSDLRERLGKVLAPYMVPAAFVVLPRIPLTGNGKIDHRALPEPDWGAAGDGAAVAPRTPVEARLAEMVAELLSLPAAAGVTDNFFALGGHSLTASRLLSRIRAAYGVDLPLRTLFADPTVAGLAAAVGYTTDDGT